MQTTFQKSNFEENAWSGKSQMQNFSYENELDLNENGHIDIQMVFHRDSFWHRGAGKPENGQYCQVTNNCRQAVHFFSSLLKIKWKMNCVLFLSIGQE